MIFLLCTLNIVAQYKVEENAELQRLQEVPLEKIYLHTSASTVLPGEYLYYKLYCINAASHKLSEISKLAYVRLLDPAGQAVFEQKLKLNAGMAAGDLFLNTDLPSGTYTLMAYTNWMKNAGLKQAFRESVTLINPYTTRQVGKNEAHSKGRPQAIRSKTPPLRLELDTTEFNTRSQVKIGLRNYQGPRGYGTYSLLVRKVPDLPETTPLSAVQFTDRYKDVDQFPALTLGDSVWLPEQRGELVFGRVVHKENGDPLPGAEVFISIPGEKYLLKSAITNKAGYFYTYLRKPYQNTTIYFQVKSDLPLQITASRPKALPLTDADIKPFVLDPAIEAPLIKRSIHNQLENAFIRVRPDSLLPREFIDPFDGGFPVTFNLDDYTRFPTLQETLIEILNYVGYRNHPEGDYIRVMQDFEMATEDYNSDPALVLIDGLLIPDHESIKTFNAKKIEWIKVLRDPLVFGKRDYQGIVYIKTFDGNYPELHDAHNSARLSLRMPLPEKRYYKQTYSGDSSPDLKRVPDYRQVLLWEPQINIEGRELQLNCFTSDVKGSYEVILEGFSSYGKPISLREEFVVR